LESSAVPRTPEGGRHRGYEPSYRDPKRHAPP
jgi:hypothetical protein